MIIQSKRVYIASTFIKAQIEIKQGKIQAIYPYGTKKVDIDYKNLRIVPGFYDIHTHGYLGFDSTLGSEKGLRKWAKDLPKEGICGFCPTTVTQSPTVLEKALKQIVKVKKKKPSGAKILGIHLEGPFINVKYKGAQPEEYIIKPSINQFKIFQKAAEGEIKIITLAPENDNNFALTKYCSSHGVNVSIGHTDATYDEAMMAIANGAKGFTHTFNAMRPFNHRENGTVGASLKAHDIYSEIICDGNHTTKEALSLFFQEKKDHGIMVTDALMCKGYPVGSKFSFGGQVVEIYPDGSSHLVHGSKALAGSTLRTNEGLRILVEEAFVPFEYAIASISSNPCKYLGIDQQKGHIQVGYDADLVILNDNYSIKQTYIEGKKQL